MAERGALSLLSLLCLTFLYTETTAAKHVDKGKCPQPTNSCAVCLLLRASVGGTCLGCVRGVGMEKRTECLGEGGNQTGG